MRIQRRCGQTAGLILFLFLAAFTGPRPAGAVADSGAGRYALVIGNSRYGGQDEVSGVEDARKMAEYLEQLQFLVIPIYDGRLEVMREGLENLKARIAHASVVVFFYSGHGFQLQRKNFLQPINGTIDPVGSMAFDEVESALNEAPNEAVKLVILDACREEKQLPAGELQGLAEPARPPVQALYAFATGPDKVAASGSKDGRSPYTNALLRSLREPGLKISQLLERVRTELVSDFGQEPSFFVNGFPLDDFYLRAPVSIHATAEADDDLLMILNGEVVLTARQKPEDDIQLKAGDNEIVLMVANGKTFHNGHDWDRTEGWNYKVKLTLPDRRDHFFGDGEDNPFKDGAHHGKVFTVARATLHVDPATAEVSILKRDDKIWESDAPVAERDQDILYDSRVTDLPLDRILDFDTGDLGDIGDLLNVLLRTGSFLGLVVAHPERIYVAVRGNKSFKNFVQVCMKEKEDDRIRDLRTSFSLTLSGHRRPFDSFDQGLTDCIRDVARTTGHEIQGDELRVWTNVENRHEDLTPSSVAGM